MRCLAPQGEGGLKNSETELTELSTTASFISQTVCNATKLEKQESIPSVEDIPPAGFGFK